MLVSVFVKVFLGLLLVFRVADGVLVGCDCVLGLCVGVLRVNNVFMCL